MSKLKTILFPFMLFLSVATPEPGYPCLDRGTCGQYQCFITITIQLQYLNN